MPHLTLEALARLVDEAPTKTEETHLAECRVCRDELQELVEQNEALGALPKLVPPPELWPELRSRLRAEDLVVRRGRIPRATLTRIAASLLLFVAGGVAGFAVRGPAVDTSTPPAQTVAEAEPENPAVLASDLSAELDRTQEAFTSALDRYMAANSTSAPDPAARLAALDNIVMTTAEALNESPADPVINSYHLTAVAQRNELLRQLSVSGEPVF